MCAAYLRIPLAALLAFLGACLSLPLPEAQAASSSSAFRTPESLMQWAADYRAHPKPRLLPAAVHAMKDLGLFEDEEKRGFCIGFIAGVLGTNRNDAPKLIAGMFPMPAKEQEVIIKAIAYSGRPDWEDLLVRFEPRMPLRKPLIDDFLTGKEKGLLQADLATGGTPLLYTLWGYYSATGQYKPVLRVIQALQWSRNKEEPGFSWKKIASGWTAAAYDVERVTTGGTAKWTLASYAERNRELLRFYQAELPNQPEEIRQPLAEVIQSAELFEAEDIRKDQLGAIQDAQKKQASSEAGMSKLATAGSIGIATGCVAAGALGQAQVAIPCVIGGALYTGAVKLMH